jgi:hypothetical protein
MVETVQILVAAQIAAGSTDTRSTPRHPAGNSPPTSWNRHRLSAWKRGMEVLEAGHVPALVPLKVSPQRTTYPWSASLGR